MALTLKKDLSNYVAFITGNKNISLNFCLYNFLSKHSIN